MATHVKWGYIQGEEGNKPHGMPIPTPIFLHLLHNYEQDGLFEAAKSSGDRFDCTINYISGGITKKQIQLTQAIVVQYYEVGEFAPNPANGGGMKHIVKLLVDEIDFGSQE